MKKFFVAVMLGLLLLSNSLAGDIYPFQSLVKKQQFFRLTHQLRCLVCQNEDIASSNAKLAADLRDQVYTMIQQNQSDQQIKMYMVKRYGDFVLFKPPVNQRTYLLWFGPFVLVVLGLLILWWMLYRYRRASFVDNKTTESDERRLREMLKR